MLGCDGENSIAKIQEIVEAYHKKMLESNVEDGKAYLDANYVDAEWNEEELEEEFEEENEFSRGGYLVKVPVTEPWLIWAYLPYGGWNSCPKVTEHMAVSKYWYEQYGAYPAALSLDTMDNAELYDELIQDEDVLINGEDEYGADCSAEFIAKLSCYMVWFKEV